MVMTIARKELKEMLRDGRFRVLSILVLGLSVVSFAAGGKHYVDVQRQYLEAKAEVLRVGDLGLSGYVNYALGRVGFYNPISAGFTTEAAHLADTSRFLAPMDQMHTLTSGLTYRSDRTGLWGAVMLEYGSGTPGGHGEGGHAHEDGDTHEHATGPGLCATRCPSLFTQNVSIGWTAIASGNRPRLSLQFDVENLSDTIHLISKESTMVRGQYSIPRLISGSLKIRF